MRKVIITVVVMLLSGIGAAQQIKIPLDLQRLAAKASETVDITMDKHMLQLASRFLNDEDQDDAEARRIISKLNGLYVRSYEFKETGAYSPADVEALLVRRTATDLTALIVPIDICYELVGVVRVAWRGLRGGDELWRHVDQFFALAVDRAQAATR